MFTGNNNIVSDQLKQMTLSQIVTTNFKAAAIFEKYSLDFCCRGNKPIDTACEEKGIDSALVYSELNLLLTKSSSSNGRYDEWSLDFLAEYIVNTHHNYVREMIPVITAHTQKVAAVHGESHPETIEIAKIFSVVYKDLKQHMMKEEQILFPYIKLLVAAAGKEEKPELPFFGTAMNPIKMMEIEHQAAGDELFEIRRLSNNYMPPEDACNTYKISYQELRDFENDLHKHVHLENNILFPKTIILEKDLLA